jgi:DNA mismatch repair ATPase MutS
MVEWGVALAWRPRTARALGGITSPEHDLTLMVDLLARLEAEPFVSVRLVGLKSSLVSASTASASSGGVPASRQIAQLRQYVSWLDSARNLMFRPFAYALMVPQLLAAAIDRWHRQHGNAVKSWLTAIGEIEALTAFATYGFEHPQDPFPTLVADGPASFEANAIAHPLMSAETAVPNDVHLGHGHGGVPPQVIVVSGSNMSGKSTLLRTVGLNVALALAGAPVRAASLRLSRVAIGATLRIDDSLQAGRSRFYSEILRIKTIVDGARAAQVLFLLDEILHGTNSYDRRIGAEAIVSSLVQLGAIGLVTTHDLALAELPEKLGPVAANMHFADKLEGGRIVFDYRMRPGVVEHSNALALMRAIGLEV